MVAEQGTKVVEYESVRCPYCDSDEFAVFIVGAELDSFRWYRRFEGFEALDYVICRTCRLIYANPRLKYVDTTLNDLFPTHVERKAESRVVERDEVRARQAVAKVAEVLDGKRGDFLEIGCGLGAVLKAAGELGFRVVGTEIYRGFVEYCRERGLDVRSGSVDRVPFDDASFDVVFLEDVLEHLKNPFAYLDDAARVLRPGGALFVHTWAIGNPTNVVDAFGADWRGNHNLDLTAHTTIFPRELLRSALTDRGFAIREADLCFELGDSPQYPPTDSRIQFWDFYCQKE